MDFLQQAQGERIQCVMPPACSPDTLSITIRKPNMTQRTLTDYVQDGFFNHVIPPNQELSPIDETLLTLKDSDLPEFLTLAILAQKNSTAYQAVSQQIKEYTTQVDELRLLAAKQQNANLITKTIP